MTKPLLKHAKLITTMTANNQQFGSRNDNPPRRINEVRTSIDKYLDKLTSLVERFIVGNTQQVKACGICTSSGHSTDAYPMLQEEPTMHANAIGGFSRPSQRGHDPFSNIYNPGWRDHPNLRYENQPQNFQKPPYQQPPPPPQSNYNSGIPFLKTSKTKIDVDVGILAMEFDNEVVSFSISGVTQNSNDMHSIFLMDFIDPLVQGNAIFDGGDAFKMTINKSFHPESKNLQEQSVSCKNKFEEEVIQGPPSSPKSTPSPDPLHKRSGFRSGFLSSSFL
ncbi:hypothetical protein Sango_2845400 [Sesamum angolense]|uniref:Uncharacterized protein n=1 Tax=Sesamum angolense TaxID=2727404 RepID=A0AAE1T755_9LAMI|nr:hypothetical protein Sango_2845400 [Sesamum angolense]